MVMYNMSNEGGAAPPPGPLLLFGFTTRLLLGSWGRRRAADPAFPPVLPASPFREANHSEPLI